MPTLPKLDSSLLVRTDFASDDDWRLVSEKAQQENADGFRAYIEPVSDLAFDGATWQAVKEAVPANDHGASVLFIADGMTLTSPDHPILVVDLTDTFLSVAEFAEIADRTPFRCIPSELCSVENNLNISNMGWEEFASAVDSSGVFRGFTT
jgi:hypothetical protein